MQRGLSERVHATMFHHGCPSLKGALDTEAGKTKAVEYAATLPAANRHAVATALHLIAILTAEMLVVHKQLCWIGRHQPGSKAIQEIYGIGQLTAPVIWAELGDVGRFSSARQVVRHSGLDISVHDSDGNRSPGHITRQGPPALRWALFEAGMCATRPTSPDHAYYKQIRARVHHKAAVMSVARKLVRRCFHTLAALDSAALSEPVSRQPRPTLT